MNFRMKKWYMQDGLTGRHPHLCYADGDDDNSPGGGDDMAAKIEDLQKKLDALSGMKSSAVAESKSEREKRRAAEAKLAAYEQAEKEREEKAALERGEAAKLLDAEKQTTAGLRKQLDDQYRDIALKDAIGSIDIAPEVKDFVEAKFKDQIKIENGVATIDGKPVQEHVKEWSETPQGKYFIRNDQSGGGAGGSDAPSDTVKKFEDMTVTEQTLHYNKLEREDPAEAKKFAAQMGWA